MNIIPYHSPPGYGSLYQFREKIKLSKLGRNSEKKDPEDSNSLKAQLEEMGVLFKVTIDMLSFVSDDEKIKVIFPRGYNNFKLNSLDEMGIKDRLLYCEGSIWRVKEIVFLKHNPYREFICEPYCFIN